MTFSRRARLKFACLLIIHKPDWNEYLRSIVMILVKTVKILCLVARCGKNHTRKKNKNVYGMHCFWWDGTNHFESVCNSFSKKSSQLKHRKKTEHYIETSDYLVLTLNIEEEEQSANFIFNTIHATRIVRGKEVTFQRDSSATCNIFPRSTIQRLSAVYKLHLEHVQKFYHNASRENLSDSHKPNKWYFFV